MYFEMLDDLLREQNGILRTSDALARGITKSQFYDYVNSAKLEKAAHGIYVSAASMDSITRRRRFWQTLRR